MKKLISVPFLMALIFLASCGKTKNVNVTNTTCEWQKPGSKYHYFVFVDCTEPYSKKIWKHVLIIHTIDESICLASADKKGSAVVLSGEINFDSADTSFDKPSYVDMVTIR